MMDFEPEFDAIPHNEEQRSKKEHSNDFLWLLQHSMQGYVTIRQASPMSQKKIEGARCSQIINKAFNLLLLTSKSSMKWIYYLSQQLVQGSMGEDGAEDIAKKIINFFCTKPEVLNQVLHEKDQQYYEYFMPNGQFYLERCFGGIFKDIIRDYRIEKKIPPIFVIKWIDTLKKIFEDPKFIERLKNVKLLNQDLTLNTIKIKKVLMLQLEKKYRVVKDEIANIFYRDFEEIMKKNADILLDNTFRFQRSQSNKEEFAAKAYGFHCQVLETLINNLLQAGINNQLKEAINLIEMPIMITISSTIIFRKKPDFDRAVAIFGLVCRTSGPFISIEQMKQQKRQICARLKFFKNFGAKFIIKLKQDPFPEYESTFKSFGNGIFEGCDKIY